MTSWNIRALYEYEATVEADTEDEAYEQFIHNLNAHYVGIEDLVIEREEEEL